MQTLSIALDWTPNTNHIGIFVAQQLGFYKELGLEVAVVHPLADNYQVSPGKKLELDEVDFSIAPFETVISLNNKPNKVHAVAIFALLQEDLSCIVSLESTEIKRMKDLDGKIYASYKARYEDLIVKEMIKADGGWESQCFSTPIVWGSGTLYWRRKPMLPGFLTTGRGWRPLPVVWSFGSFT